MRKPKDGRSRTAAYREAGRSLSVVLRDPAAIAELDKLAEKHGGVTAAVSYALIHAAASKGKP